MKIHAISTGEVQITRNWIQGKGEGFKRLLNTVLDKEKSEWLPIWCFVIEHPEGLIVVDTGISSNANDPIYFPPYMPLIQRAAKFRITEEQEIGHQMRERGLNPEDVKYVILTHLHQDHDGGLHHFPNAEFIVSRTEWNIAKGLVGRLSGYLNHRWPEFFQPRLVDFDEIPFHSFASHYTLAEDVHLVPTPGHSQGHLSVILNDGDWSIVFAGDTSYTQELLIAQKTDGVGDDLQAQLDTHEKILAYAAQHPTIYLPSHDPASKERLENRAVINVNRVFELQDSALGLPEATLA